MLPNQSEKTAKDDYQPYGVAVDECERSEPITGPYAAVVLAKARCRAPRHRGWPVRTAVLGDISHSWRHAHC